MLHELLGLGDLAEKAAGDGEVSALCRPGREVAQSIEGLASGRMGVVYDRVRAPHVRCS